MSQTNKVIIYEPDNSLKKGYLFIFKEIFEELKENRWLTYQLFKRDVLTLYKQSFVGVLWVFIFPLLSVGTFIILSHSGIFTIGKINVPYPVYAILGIAFWQIFAAGIVATSNSLVKAGSMIVKINFSKKSLVIAACGQAIIAFIIQIMVLAILLICYRVRPGIAFIFLPLFMLPLALLSLGLGFILSVLNGIVRDVGNIISILVTFLMFLTPVLYINPASGIIFYITRYNILYHLISTPRDIILFGLRNTMPQLPGFIISAVMASIIFAACLIVFHLTETRVAERI